MISDLFAAWSLYGVTVAVISGLVMGEVTRRLRLFRSARRMAWSLAIVGLFWYIPVWVRLETDPASTINVVRNASGGLLWALVYVIPAVVWRWLQERREH